MEKDFKYKVCVVGGCGHVGLPLAIMFADKGLDVSVYDINSSAFDSIKSGKLPFYEKGAEEVLERVLKKDKLHFYSDPSVISESEVVIIIIGTPVDEHLNPRVDALKRSFESFMKYMNDDQLLVLRSTVYPGVTKRVKDWLEEENHFCDIAYCPERILEGNAVAELSSLPQIVSSFTDSGIKRATDLFRTLTDDIVVIEPLEAELTKLCTNVWRYIKFAVSNQFYTMANDYNVDFYNIHYAMTHNYPRCKDFPKPGFAAGPCLFKDTMQLGAFYDNNFNLGHTAMLINEGLPNYVCKCLKKEYDLSKLTIGILGMAFKADSDDIRESLSYKVKKLFEFEAKNVLCSDPYVHDDSFVSTDELLEKSDIVIIATPHKQYRELNITSDKKVVDIWNVLGHGGKI